MAQSDFKSSSRTWLSVVGAAIVALSTTIGAIFLHNINSEILRAQANITELVKNRDAFRHNINKQLHGTTDVVILSGLNQLEEQLKIAPHDSVFARPSENSLAREFEGSRLNINNAYRRIEASCGSYNTQPRIDHYIRNTSGESVSNFVRQACGDVSNKKLFSPPSCKKFVTSNNTFHFIKLDDASDKYSELYDRLECAGHLYTIPNTIADADIEIMWQVVFSNEEEYARLQIILSVLTLLGLVLILLKDLPFSVDERQ